MRSLGLAVDIPNRGRPTVRAVVLEDMLAASQKPALSDVSIVESFSLPSQADDIPTQLRDLADAIRGRLRNLGIDVVVVRRADKPPRPSGADGPKLRLLVEGAVASAAKSLVQDTRLLSGRDLGVACGSTKAAVEADGATLVSDAKLTEASGAALTGLMSGRH